MNADDGDPRSYAIIGAAMEVHRVLGPGFLESIYHEALAVEFSLREVPFRREVSLPVTYKGHAVGGFRTDFVCFDSVIVELKAQLRVSSADDGQVINYLKAAAREVGLLLNFGASRLEYRRLIRTLDEPAPSADCQTPAV